MIDWLEYLFSTAAHGVYSNLSILDAGRGRIIAFLQVACKDQLNSSALVAHQLSQHQC
jgi:hypothetical protein